MAKQTDTQNLQEIISNMGGTKVRGKKNLWSSHTAAGLEEDRKILLSPSSMISLMASKPKVHLVSSKSESCSSTACLLLTANNQ